MAIEGGSIKCLDQLNAKTTLELHVGVFELSYN
jgi:hypothetical protein